MKTATMNAHGTAHQKGRTTNHRTFTLKDWEDAGYGWCLGLDTLPEPRSGTAENGAWNRGKARADRDQEARLLRQREEF